jgi:SMC interacting uncharacterized protein involved in chromosome segregation
MAHITQESEGENLSRIRDILFGEDLQSIEQKLDTAKDENSASLEELKTEIEKRLEEIDQLQEKKFNEIVSTQEKNIENQKGSLNEIKQEITSLKELINNSLEQFNNKASNLENTINQSINQLKEEYKLKIEELDNNKLDKNTIADMLIELAENIKKQLLN